MARLNKARSRDPADILNQHSVVDGAGSLPGCAKRSTPDRRTRGTTNHSHRPNVPMLINEPELYWEADPKMSAALPQCPLNRGRISRASAQSGRPGSGRPHQTAVLEQRLRFFQAGRVEPFGE
jgi:hypothetical protein